MLRLMIPVMFRFSGLLTNRVLFVHWIMILFVGEQERIRVSVLSCFHSILFWSQEGVVVASDKLLSLSPPP